MLTNFFGWIEVRIMTQGRIEIHWAGHVMRNDNDDMIMLRGYTGHRYFLRSPSQVSKGWVRRDVRGSHGHVAPDRAGKFR